MSPVLQRTASECETSSLRHLPATNIDGALTDAEFEVEILEKCLKIKNLQNFRHFNTAGV
jgi:hypothetical protein